MNWKLRFWRWLAIGSMLLGAGETAWRLTGNTGELTNVDFSLSHVSLNLAIFSGITFLGLALPAAFWSISMNWKPRFWRWLAIGSVLLGAGETGWHLTGNPGELTDVDFSLSHVSRDWAVFSGITFIGLALPAGLIQWTPKYFVPFFRWLFTWRILKRVPIVLVGLAGIVAAFYWEEDWRGQHAWEKYHQAEEARGEHLDFAHFIPPPVPDDQNFALAPVVASGYRGVMDQHGHLIKPANTNVVNRLIFDLVRYATNGEAMGMSTNLALGRWPLGGLVDLKAWQDYFRQRYVTNQVWTYSRHPGRLGEIPFSGTNEPGRVGEMVALVTNDFPVAAEPQCPATDVLLALSKFDPALVDLREAARRPASRFPLAYDQPNPGDIILPYLGPLFRCAQLLALRACAELATGQSEPALADIKLALRLAEAIHSEPFRWSLDTRVGIVNGTMQPVWEGLVHHQWNESELDELELELGRLDILSDATQAARAECAFTLKVIDYCQTNRDAWVGYWGTYWYEGDSDFMGRPGEFCFYAFPSGWQFQGKLLYAQVHTESVDHYIDLPHRQVSPDKINTLWDAVTLAIKGNAPWAFYTRSLFTSVRPRFYSGVQTAVDSARIAVALEHYRHLHGEYPETLAAAASLLPGPMPHDLITGQPLHYRRTAGGNFLLYSVGWNGRDDGGVPSDYNNSHQKWGSDDVADWVWMFPAQ